MSLASETTAICGAINSKFSLTDPAVAPDDAAGMTADHIIVFVSRRFTDSNRASGEVSVAGGRVVTRYVSKSLTNVSNSQAKARSALEDQIVGSLGPFVFETEDPVDQDDDGFWVAADSWTY